MELGVATRHRPARGERRPRDPHRVAGLHRLRRIALVAALVALIPVLSSYLGTMAEPSNSSLGVRTVEWLRDHGAAGLVAQVESTYYALTAPGKGGPTLRTLPRVGYGAGAAARAHGAGGSRTRQPGGAGQSAPAAYRPGRVAPLIHPALAGEGVWRATRPGLEANPPVLLTTLRNQPEYPRVVAGLAWIDSKRTTVTLNPGRKEPSVSIPRGPMDLPRADRGRLLASFNSGFKLSDSGGGLALNGHTYAAMRDGQATLVGYRDGRVNVVDWRGGPIASGSVAFARQNLPLIVNEGRPGPNLDSGEWGATVGAAILVWRSGIGVDRHGNLIYAAGDNQTVRSLADTLIHAGAVRAMELDINSYWVSFITYRAPGAGDPTNLLPDMTRSASRYLEPDDRDFFAVYAR
jgi:Phosphodiester glycosidase